MSGPADGKPPIIENATREALERALQADAPEPESADGKKPPLGHAERVLNFRDRNLLFGACRTYCTKDGHKGLKDQVKLDKLKKIINFDETLDYNVMMEEAQEEAVLKWQRETNCYKLWRRCKMGLVAIDVFRKEFPEVDPNGEVAKPPLRQPELSAEEVRGKERSFYFPTKLDAWAQDAIRDMEWHTNMTEFAVELARKFGLQVEE